MHTAIIMDGNGRWAERRGLPRTSGHRAGAKTVRRIVEAATRGTIDVLTLYAFSSDNWARPAIEVSSLMRLLKRYLVSETARCLDNGVRLSVIGRRDRLIYERVRLGIMSALSVNPSMSFAELKELLQTSDGNLSIHARKLEDAGYVTCRKKFAARVPKTEFSLTTKGKRMFARHLEHMEALIQAAKGT